MWRYLGIIIVLFATSCGTDTTEEAPPPAPQAVTWDEAKAIIDKNCALSGCHADGARGDFISSGVKFKDSPAQKKLSGKLMPPPGTAAAANFSDADRQKLLSYLAG